MTIGWIGSVTLAATLAYAGASKLVTLPASGRSIAELLRVGSPRAAKRITVLAGTIELTLCVGVLLQIPATLSLTALLLSGFLALHAWTLATRGSGVPCGCYGPRSVVSGVSVLGLAAWAALAWALVLMIPHRVEPALMGWSAAAVTFTALVATLGVARELARRVAILTEETGAPGALEIESEGPAVGRRLALPGDSGNEPLRLAVFLSPACGLCRRLEPAIQIFSKRPGLQLTMYDEESHAEAWRLAGVPGSPYAIARDASGHVLAKGAFNTIRQLESVCATAIQRAEHLGGLDVQAA